MNFTPLETAMMGHIDREIERHPDRLRPLDPALIENVRVLTKDVIYDIDAPPLPCG